MDAAVGYDDRLPLANTRGNFYFSTTGSPVPSRVGFPRDNESYSSEEALVSFDASERGSTERDRPLSHLASPTLRPMATSESTLELQISRARRACAIIVLACVVVISFVCFIVVIGVLHQRDLPQEFIVRNVGALLVPNSQSLLSR